MISMVTGGGRNLPGKSIPHRRVAFDVCDREMNILPISYPTLEEFEERTGPIPREEDLAEQLPSWGEISALFLKEV